MNKYEDVIKAFFVYKSELKKNEKLDKNSIENLQNKKLQTLVQYAVEHSPFYKRLYENIDTNSFSIAQLPVIDKKMMMDNFDDFLTDRKINIKNISNYLENPKENLFMKQYQVMSTGGSSGVKGIILYNKAEWQMALAGVLRWMSFMNVPSFKIPRVKSVDIGGDNPTHGSYRLSKSFDIGISKKMHLNANEELRVLVKKLNSFNPDFISGYSSILHQLATEQILGRLNINPKTIVTTSEVCTKSMQEKMNKAWGINPFMWYGMTEVMTLASDCKFHKGLHIFEDIAIVEIVDNNNNPVPLGTKGSKMLLTNLYNYTQPIIRYEIDDVVTLVDKSCICGNNFSMIKSIEGRQDDILFFTNRNGKQVSFHPLNFWTIFDTMEQIAAFQIELTDKNLTISIVSITENNDNNKLSAQIISELEKQFDKIETVVPNIRISVVDEIKRSDKSNKLKTIIDNREKKL